MSIVRLFLLSTLEFNGIKGFQIIVVMNLDNFGSLHIAIARVSNDLALCILGRWLFGRRRRGIGIGIKSLGGRCLRW